MAMAIEAALDRWQADGAVDLIADRRGGRARLLRRRRYRRDV
jgi:hypothetical protein